MTLLLVFRKKGASPSFWCICCTRNIRCICNKPAFLHQATSTTFSVEERKERILLLFSGAFGAAVTLGAFVTKTVNLHQNGQGGVAPTFKNMVVGS